MIDGIRRSGCAGRRKGRNEAQGGGEMKTTRYKDSELGPVPEDWEVRRLGDVLSIGNGRDYKYLPKGDVPVYGTGGLMTYVNMFLHDGPTVCIGRKGTIDEPQYHEGKIWTVDTLFYTYDFKGVDPRFLYYLFMCIDWRGYNTATGVPSLTAKSIYDIEVHLPPLPEQRAIAAALSDVDGLLAAMAALIGKKRAIRQGAMQDLLEAGAPPAGESPAESGEREFAPRRRLAGFSGAWVEKRLGDVADFMSVTVRAVTIDKTWYIGTENMLSDKMGVERNDADVPYQDVREYQVGDILISNIRPYLKKIWLADRGGGCSTDVLVIRSKDKNACAPAFLKMILSNDAFFEFAMANAIGTKMPRGDKKVLVNYEFHMPTLTEQKAIASVLSDMDAEIAVLEAKRAKYEKVKQGMMQDLLTGKTRLGG